MAERYPIHNFNGAYLKTVEAGTGFFPASRIQKGLVLGQGNRDLSEEGARIPWFVEYINHRA
jgi:hypothetical protein